MPLFRPGLAFGGILGENHEAFAAPMATGSGSHSAFLVASSKRPDIGILRFAGMVMAGGRTGVPSTPVPRPSAVPTSRATLLLRTGDRAPVEARVPESFAGTLGFLPDGRLTFI